MTNCDLTLGYDLDQWNGYGIKTPVAIDLSPQTNSHILICGISGSGKSFALNTLTAKLAQIQPHGEFYFADYKGDDSFAHLRGCPRYWSYKNTVETLDIVYARMNARLSGTDKSREPITFIWDEYMANILALQNEDKKKAAVIMNQVSEILLMGRSMSVRLITSMQRPDALAFPAGSRLNYGVVIVLGAAIKSIYEMLLPDFTDKVKGRHFRQGEGVVLFQGSELRFIKIPTIQNHVKMEEICRNALM